MHFQQYMVSRPRVTENSIVTRDGKIELDDARIYVRPTNHVLVGSGVGWTSGSVKPVQNWFRGTPYFGGGKQSRFFIELYVEAKRELTVIPAEMILTMATGESKKPSAYVGALGMWSTRNYSLALCDPVLNLKHPIDENVVVGKNSSLCVAIVFDIEPPLPTEEFHLDLNGVEVENKKIVLPTIIFEQGIETGASP